MKFIDRTEIHLSAGDGGDGMISFRTARNMPKLGPDGGNGGNGGDVTLIACASINTLSSLRYRQVYRAQDGGKGSTNNKTGKCGAAKIIPVPCGTILYDRETNELLGELLEDGETLLAAKGGKRGYGNLQFTKSTRRAPHKATNGQKGESRTLRLELKLLADVGLAGFPNAGKSTLLSQMSAAKPKIADYPFTTLVPNLGVVEIGQYEKDFASYVIADVPGLIEGASIGKGLGHDFLRHLERTRIIGFIVDSFSFDDSSPLDNILKLKKELEHYSQKMLIKKTLIILNKIDIAEGSEELAQQLEESKKELVDNGYEFVTISAATGEGIATLKLKFYDMLNQCKIEEEKAAKEAEKNEDPDSIKAFAKPKIG